MKKILFVINSLTIGGSEKSLISLLNLLDLTKFQVDLMMFKKGGEFDQYIPDEVNVIEEPEYYKYLTSPKKFTLTKKIKFKYHRLKTSFNIRFYRWKKRIIQIEQILYKSQREVLEPLDKEYDVAIAYSQGMPTYFVVDKVKAKKKLAWINCDYVNTMYDKELDRFYYNKIDKIIVVSKSIQDSIGDKFPYYKNKLELILDIVNPQLIEEMAEDEVLVTELKGSTCLNILTVGRLITHHKGYDTAVKAAKLLMDHQYKFKWFVVGEGSDRIEIEKLIEENGLNAHFILLGKRVNPYPYMKQCDLYVQPSKKEGFGLTVVEAKILKKPIVCTNFNTARELISHGHDGLIVGHSEQELFLGIKKYIEDDQFKNTVLNQLNHQIQYSSIHEIQKIYQLIS